MVSPRPLPEVADLTDVGVVRAAAPADRRSTRSGHLGCGGCEDLNDVVGAARDDLVEGAPVGLTAVSARRLRQLYDLQAAALAAAVLLLSSPHPEMMAAARPRVARGAGTMVTAQCVTVAVPEHARALLRGWAGRSLWPREWADDVAATYLTLRLEIAERHSGVTVLDPELPVLAPVAWHERNDPGAAQRAWMTRSRTLVT